MKAMLLAAGHGTRMGELTRQMPKPMLQAGGKPLIVHLIERLRAAGLRELVINVAWQGAVLMDYLQDGRELDVSIRYSNEVDALETAGGIRNALTLLNAEDSTRPFLVVNADIWTDYPFERLVRHADHLQQHLQALLVLIPNPAHHPRGDFGFSAASQETSIPRTPEDALALHWNSAPRFTFSGIGLYRPELFSGVPAGPWPLAPVLRDAMSKHRVCGHLYEGEWQDIGTPDRLAALDARLYSTR